MESIENYIGKRGSGRSNIIETCIRTLSEALNSSEYDMEEIKTLIINNTLPNELRSIVWKIFLGILPKEKNLFEWVQIIRNERQNFEKLSSGKEIEDFVRVIRKEADESILTQDSVLEEYHLIFKELQKVSTNYDFFKSQIVAETLLKLFIIWKKNNTDVQTNSIEVFYILAGVIYALYPSILHFSTDLNEINQKEDVDPKTLFYFLNNEEFFDSDVYIIFNHLMINKNFKLFISNYNKLSRQEWEVILKEIISVEELFPLTEDKKILISNLNRLEKISYVYLTVANKNLLDYFSSIQLDPYDIVQTWFTSLMTSSICFEHLPYLWDNIFLNSMEETLSLEFLDYILVALLSNLEVELLSSDIVNAKKTLMRYPEHFLNLKEIIKKSLKIREKINELLQ